MSSGFPHRVHRPVWRADVPHSTRPSCPGARGSRRRRSRTRTPARSTPRCARTRRRATSPSPWRSQACRRCSTAPATSTARATAAACWSTSRARSGPRRSAPAATTRRWRSTPRSRSPTSSSSAPQDLEQVRHDAREILGRAGFRILAERRRRGRLAGARRRPRARRSRTSGRSAACVPDAETATGDLFELMIELEDAARRPRPLVLRDHLRLQGDGRAEGARRATTPTSPTSASRRSAASATTATRPTPGPRSSACSRSRSSATTARSTRSSSCARRRAMLGVPIDAGRLRLPGPEPDDRAPWSGVEGLSLAEAMEMVVPPIVDEIRALPAELHPFYMYLRQTMGPFAQGPVALIARHDDECVFSADALGLRPLWQARDRRRLRLQLRARRGLGRRDGLRAEAARAGREVHGHDRPRASAARGCARTSEMQRVVAERWLERTGADERRGLRPRARDRRPARGPRDPRLHRRPGPSEPVKVADRGPRRLRLAARRRQALSSRWPRTAPSRSARSATTARSRRSRPSARTSPTTSRRRSRSSPTRRSTASARSSTSRPARSSAAGPRSTTPRPTRARSRPRSRSSSAATTSWRRSATSTYRRIAREHQTYLLEDLWEEFRDRAGRDRHRPARVRDDPGRDRADQAGGGQGRPRAAPSCSCSPTAPSTTASAATSTRTWRPRRSTRR